MDDDLLRRYLDYLAVEKGLSKNTLESYGRDLRRYFRFLKQRGPKDIGKKDVADFLGLLSAEGIASPSIARSLAAVRGFHKFLLMDNLSDIDPTSAIDTPRGWKRLPRLWKIPG
jgi:integrase/recombinase XerD